MKMLKKKDKYHIAIVGATGLVGRTFRQVIDEYHIPYTQLSLLASEKSKGKIITFQGKELIVQTLNEHSFEGIDIALFSAGASVSKIWAVIARNSGCLVIDNSSAWRTDADIPLVVPEVNPDMIALSGIIANPNCSTIQSVLPLKALQDAFGLSRVNYATYQAVSGSGEKGIDDYHLSLQEGKNSFYPYPITKTCIPEIDRALDNGYTYEEMKMLYETRKILDLPALPVSATCIRVPILVGHGVLIQATLKKEATVEQIKKVFNDFPGIIVVDDLANHQYPTSILAKGNDAVYVGRIRKDLFDPFTVLFYTTADNVRKGAASNAVQIAMKAMTKAGDFHD